MIGDPFSTLSVGRYFSWWFRWEVIGNHNNSTWLWGTNAPQELASFDKDIKDKREEEESNFSTSILVYKYC